MSLSNQRDRAYSDLLEAERRLRSQSEKNVRELRDVLAEVAVRVDGVRFEEMRRSNPAFPGTLSAQGWRAWFQLAPTASASSWGGVISDNERTEALEALVSKLKGELAGAQAKLQEAQRELLMLKAVPRPEQVENKKPSTRLAGMKPVMVLSGATKSIIPESSIPEGVTPPYAGILSDILAVKTAESYPPQWRRQIDPGDGDNNRSPEERRKAWIHKQLILYYVGRWGINARQEVESLLRSLEEKDSTSGSVHRLFAAMERGGLLVSEKFELKTPKLGFVMYHLSADGANLYRDLFGANPIESDWEKLKRAHEGTRFPVHTVSILIFSVHARRRGWNTQVLPIVEGDAEPDIVINKGAETLYCEVEIGRADKPPKWRNNADLNAGRVAMCASTIARRSTLTSDCAMLKLSGVATDIETLVKSSYHNLTGDENLWDETW